MTISGKKISQKWFLFDGCHKFYLIDSPELTEDMKKAGYNINDIRPIDDLPYEFYNSCSLRFIETWDNFKRIVPQCRRFVTFKGFGSLGWNTKIDFQKDEVYTDEPAAHFKNCSNITFKRIV